MKKKIIWAVSILFVCIILGSLYYLGQLNSQKRIEDRRAFLYEKKKECQDVCSIIYEKDYAENDNYVTGIIAVPKYSYNEKLNTCLYSSIFSMSSNGLFTQESTVMDCYTNKIIIHSLYINKNLKVGLTEEEFEKQRKELMEQ
jgi:hypothetical protein